MKKILAFLSSLILILLSAYTIHDMQSSQGVGYYFCLQFGKENRLPFDIAVDIVFLFLLALLLLLPVFCRKVKEKNALARFIILFIATVPSLRTDFLLSVIAEPELFSSKVSVSNWLASFLSSFQILLILFPLAIGYFCVVKGNCIKKSFFILPAIVFAVILLALFIPALSDLLFFLACYLLLISLFDLLEKSAFNNICFYGFLFLTAIYRLLFVSASWSI